MRISVDVDFRKNDEEKNLREPNMKQKTKASTTASRLLIRLRRSSKMVLQRSLSQIRPARDVECDSRHLARAKAVAVGLCVVEVMTPPLPSSAFSPSSIGSECRWEGGIEDC